MNVQYHFILPERPYQNLDEYHQEKGDALSKARSMSSEEIIKELKASLLRGRGGGGFLTGQKWQTLYEDPCETKYVVINAAEGEPGTFKDRMVMRKNPYAMIEGALIAAYVLNTNEVYICIKGSFHLEMDRIYEAIKDFKKKGLLQGININLVAGPEDYLYGEEKAMLNVIEGIGPLPREAHYPPYIMGLFSTPTSSNPALVNNVETYARVPQILLRGAESFASIGTETTTGPFICTVSGDVQKEGVFEITPGITLRELLHEYAQGPRPGREFKVILNGVASAVITSDHLDVKLDYNEMAKIGSWLGSCSFIVYDDERSAVRVAQEAALFLYDESCNQCPPCKGGLRVSSTHIDSLFTQEQDSSVLQHIVNGAKSAPRENRCYLPVQGSVLIPSLMNAFKEEFEALLGNKGPVPPKVVFPKIVDYLKQTSRFVLKEDHFDERPRQAPWEESRFFLDRQSYTR